MQQIPYSARPAITQGGRLCTRAHKLHKPATVYTMNDITTHSPELVHAVTVTATAKVAGMNPHALRARVKRGSVDGFKEMRWDNPNARWFVTLELAQQVVAAEGGNVDDLEHYRELVRPQLME